MRLSPRSKRKYIIVSVGGSLIVPDQLDTDFLERFRACILNHVERGFSFFIITGGGRTARRYQEAGSAVRELHPEDLDWLGIHATQLNAHLMRSLFKEVAQERIVKNPTRRIRTKAPIIIGAGWRPGASTDYCAVLAAKQLDAHRLVNLSDTDYVYDKNPDDNPDANPLTNVDWETFRTLIPDHWDPGLSSPFDPVAAKEAQRLKLEVAVLNGQKLEELEKYLAGEEFTGTVIS